MHLGLKQETLINRILIPFVIWGQRRLGDAYPWTFKTTSVRDRWSVMAGSRPTRWTTRGNARAPVKKTGPSYGRLQSNRCSDRDQNTQNNGATHVLYLEDGRSVLIEENWWIIIYRKGLTSRSQIDQTAHVRSSRPYQWHFNWTQ